MSRPSEHRDAPPPRPSLVDQARVGQVIDGRYRLDAIVGRGGMGLVYKAEHIGIRRVVALKLLHTTLASVPELRSRFEREARAIGVISHPNCVDISDFGELADGSLYLVMEYLEGRSLGDLLESERVLEPRRALRILRHVLAGLGHAHQVGIIHRDVKPENVLLVEHSGDPDFAKILDFGIAKLVAAPVDDGVKLTQAGVAFGTPVYMAPEQALGNPVDGRADLYAASVMAYEMLCGRPPFYSDDKLEVLSMHTARPLPSMDEVRRSVLGANAPALPDGLEALLVRGLAKQPTGRFQNAAEYTAAIDEFLIHLALDDEPIVIHDRPPRAQSVASAMADAPGARLFPTGSTPLVVDGLEGVTSAVPLAASPSEPILLERSQARLPPSPRATRRRPAWMAAVGGGLLVALAAAGLLLLRNREPSRPPPPSEIANEAAAKLERGDPVAAIEKLEAKKEEIAEDPNAQLQLGHAYAARREHAPALLAYRRALELSPALERDPTMRASLTAISDDTDREAAMAAFEILIQMTSDPEAKPRLITAASGGELERRRAARGLVEKLGFGSEVDWLAGYLLDLEQGETCERRKEAVEKLRALGDQRSIPALELAIVRKGKTARWKGKLVNKCLADDARAAISFLANLPEADAQPAP